jgi:hypothetical protein
MLRDSVKNGFDAGYYLTLNLAVKEFTGSSTANFKPSYMDIRSVKRFYIE